MRDKLLSEISNLGSISVVCAALVDYAQSLEMNSKFELESDRYVLRPKNFVTFSVHHKRVNNLTVTLRGNISEFEPQRELPIKKDQNGYSIFRLENVPELAAATMYIRRARELYDRGRQRPLKTLKTVEM